MVEYLDKNGIRKLTEGIKEHIPVINNQNLLINPDFRINQRGVTEAEVIYEDGVPVKASQVYTADRWQISDGRVNIEDDGSLTLFGKIRQVLEFRPDYPVTASVSAGSCSYDENTGVFEIIGNGENIRWAKLEAGSFPTAFITPDIPEELRKCQRFYERIDVPTSSFFTAVQRNVQLNKIMFSAAFTTEKRNNESVIRFINNGARFVSSQGIFYISGFSTDTVTKSFIGAVGTLSSATPQGAFGWVDRFEAEADNEIYL